MDFKTFHVSDAQQQGDGWRKERRLRTAGRGEKAGIGGINSGTERVRR